MYSNSTQSEVQPMSWDWGKFPISMVEQDLNIFLTVDSKVASSQEYQGWLNNIENSENYVKLILGLEKQAQN